MNKANISETDFFYWNLYVQTLVLQVHLWKYETKFYKTAGKVIVLYTLILDVPEIGWNDIFWNL